MSSKADMKDGWRPYGRSPRATQHHLECGLSNDGGNHAVEARRWDISGTVYDEGTTTVGIMIAGPGYHVRGQARV